MAAIPWQQEIFYPKSDCVRPFADEPGADLDPIAAAEVVCLGMVIFWYISPASRMDTVGELQAFFSACGRREEGQEPDWQDHPAVIEASKSLAQEMAEGYEAEARNSSLDSEWAAEVETEGL